MTVERTTSSTTYDPTTASAQPDAPPVMPDPQTEIDAGGDSMAMIYELMSKQRDNDMTSGATKVKHNQELAKAHENEQQDELKKQADAAASAATWGILGKVASVVAIAVSGVLSVCSCGAASGLCIAACALSALAFVDGETQCLSKLTGDPDASKWFDMGCGIAAAVCSGGSGIAASGVGMASRVLEVAGSACKIAQQVISNTTTDQGWQYAAMGLGAAGAIGDMAFGGGAQATSQVFGVATKVVKVAAAVTGAVASATQGVATIVQGQYQADSIDRGADAKDAALQVSRLDRLTEWVLDGLKETDNSHKRALETLQGAMQTKAQTLVIASAKV